MKLDRSIVLATLVAAFGVAAARPTAAQQTDRRFVLTPYAGVFVPATRVAEIKETDGDLTATMGIRQQTVFALGVNASYWFNKVAGLEFGGAWAFSDAKASVGLSDVPGFSFSGTQSARVLMASAKLMVNIIPLTERSALRLGVGPAIISHGGSAYRNDDGKFTGLTDIGGAVSLCSRIPMTDFVSLRLRAENYIYQSKLRFEDAADPTNDFSFGSKLQNDFIFSAGLQMNFWR